MNYIVETTKKEQPLDLSLIHIFIKVYNILKSRSDLEALLPTIRASQLLDPKLIKIKERMANQNSSINQFCCEEGILFIKNKYIEPRRLESNHSQNHGEGTSAVSYTHLDVYKRQFHPNTGL